MTERPAVMVDEPAFSLFAEPAQCVLCAAPRTTLERLSRGWWFCGGCGYAARINSDGACVQYQETNHVGPHSRPVAVFPDGADVARAPAMVTVGCTHLGEWRQIDIAADAVPHAIKRGWVVVDADSQDPPIDVRPYPVPQQSSVRRRTDYNSEEPDGE